MMKFSIIICLVLLIIIIANASEEQKRQSVPQLPISVLEELLSPNNNNNNVDSDSSSLAALIPGLSSNSGSGSGGSTGIPFVDFFRNLIAMFINTFLQFFKVFTMLSQTLTGNQSDRLLLRNERNADVDKVSAAEGIPLVQQLEENLRLVQRSIQELSQKFVQLINSPDGSGVPVLYQFDKFLQLWQNQAKTLTNQARRLLTDTNLRTISKNENQKRDKRQLLEDLNQHLETMQLPVESLINEFYKSLAKLNDVKNRYN